MPAKCPRACLRRCGSSMERPSIHYCWAVLSCTRSVPFLCIQPVQTQFPLRGCSPVARLSRLCQSASGTPIPCSSPLLCRLPTITATHYRLRRPGAITTNIIACADDCRASSTPDIAHVVPPTTLDAVRLPVSRARRSPSACVHIGPSAVISIPACFNLTPLDGSSPTRLDSRPAPLLMSYLD